MRAVIDTNLLVSAMISRPGSTSRRLLDAVRDGRLTLILSRQLIDEFRDVMRRPKFARYGITIGDILDFIAALLALACVVEITGSARGCDDPDDDAVIETAEVGAANYLIAGDADLLDARIRASLGQLGIEVMTASDFLPASASRAVPRAIDHARMIVAMRSALPLPRPAKLRWRRSSGCALLGNGGNPRSTAPMIDVPPSASPSVARAITTARASSPARRPRTPGAATPPAGGSSPTTRKPSGGSHSARTRPSSRPSWGICASAGPPPRHRALEPRRSDSFIVQRG